MANTATMRAAAAMSLGAPLTVIDVPRPTPGAGEALIEVDACGLNFADTLLVGGRYQERQEPPIRPGLEIVGRVVDVGPGVALGVGARVVAACSGGGLAEYAVVAERACAPLPDMVSDVVGAALPIAYATSHVALADRADLRAGERLLVTGAAGGVGLAAVEIGRLLGADVVAVARGDEKRSVAEAAGAHASFDADDPNLLEALRGRGGIDVAYETVGEPLWRTVFRAARPGARLLPIGFAGGEVPQIPANVLMVKNLTVIGFYWGGWLRARPEAFGDSLAFLVEAAADGRVSPRTDAALPLDDAELGLQRLRDRSAIGKIVVRPRG